MNSDVLRAFGAFKWQDEKKTNNDMTTAMTTTTNNDMTTAMTTTTDNDIATTMATTTNNDDNDNVDDS